MAVTVPVPVVVPPWNCLPEPLGGKPLHGSIVPESILFSRQFEPYKITIERPDRRSAQFTAENIASLRFDKALFEPMQYLYQQHGEQVYNAEYLAQTEQEITT